MRLELGRAAKRERTERLRDASAWKQGDEEQWGGSKSRGATDATVEQRGVLVHQETIAILQCWVTTR